MDHSGIIATVEGENKDWINELPDCILSSIVSLLRIEDAVGCCMISRQWRDLWKTRSNLEFDIPNIFGGKYDRLVEKHEEKDYLENLVDRFDRQCFVRRVNEVLELYAGNKVDSLKVAFFFDVESTAILDEWILFAITKGAQVLDLQLFKSRSSEPEPEDVYVFPHWILSSALKHLSLQRCALKPPPDYFDRFAQLTTLCLNKVFVDPGFSAHLLSVCVLLENLTLRNCRVRSNLIVGPSLHLKDLKVLRCQIEKIEIDAVNLSSFEYCGNILKISRMSTPQLVRFFFEGVYFICGLPYALTQLALCPGLETPLLQMSNDLENIPETVATFKNLKQVSLDVFMNNFDLGSVVNFLKAAPVLEEFIITTRASNYQGEMRDVCGFCHKHLRKVKMQGFQGKWLEIELAKCILKIATKLEVMVIDPHGKYCKGDGRWTDIEVCYYVDGNECENEDEYVDSDEGNSENEVADEGVDVDTLKESNENEVEDVDPEEGNNGNEDMEPKEGSNGNKDEQDKGVDVEEGSEHENKDAEEMSEEDEDYETYDYFRWKRRGRAIVQERLKQVKTDAQIIVL
ncbi:hypothetical protein M0R45_033404 [Rubus argutus]|uniref:F-box domain-containing protein n=1 Tax=Rubus argutus TaxID=59490 RepID=A0AAW1WN43_RUBAR